MSADALTGFLAWLESAPPSAYLDVPDELGVPSAADLNSILVLETRLRNLEMFERARDMTRR